MTLGAKGARWNKTVYRTEECEVFDVSGAGDTFLAALVYEYLVSEDLEKAVHFIEMIIERDYKNETEKQESWVEGYKKWKANK